MKFCQRSRYSNWILLIKLTYLLLIELTSDFREKLEHDKVDSNFWKIIYVPKILVRVSYQGQTFKYDRLAHLSFLEIFIESHSTVEIYNVYFTGDLNMPHVSWSSRVSPSADDKWEVESSTHKHGNFLDLCFVTSDYLYSVKNDYTALFSDHFRVHITLDLPLVYNFDGHVPQTNFSIANIPILYNWLPSIQQFSAMAKSSDALYVFEDWYAGVSMAITSISTRERLKRSLNPFLLLITYNTFS